MTLPASLAHPCNHDDDAARETFEAIRWPNGSYCPHCGSFDIVAPLGGKSMGLVLVHKCREKFTARVGSVMERSHIPMHTWLLAFRLMASSKKGMSAHQLHRMLGVSYKAAWFMAHRIREAMRPTDGGQLGGEGKTVEADETYVGEGEESRVCENAAAPRSCHVARRARRQGALAPRRGRDSHDAEADPG